MGNSSSNEKAKQFFTTVGKGVTTAAGKLASPMTAGVSESIATGLNNLYKTGGRVQGQLKDGTLLVHHPMHGSNIPIPAGHPMHATIKRMMGGKRKSKSKK
jgi:hypothetical protein